MKYTGERFVPLYNLMNDETAFEHFHRYHHALEFVKDKIALDIACGEGYGAALLAGKAQKVYGVDIDSSCIEHAKKKYERDNLKFLQGNAAQIPLPDHSIDIVISFETIEHLDEKTQESFLHEIKRVLRENGNLVISTPDKENYSARYTHQNEFHIKEFDEKEFYSFLNSRFKNIVLLGQRYEIVDAITGKNLDELSETKVCNWERDTQPISFKYLIAVCSDSPLEKELQNPSIVFQVSKDYWKVTDRMMEMETHILELGAWGRRLDKEVGNISAEKKEQSVRLQKITADLENKNNLIESFYKSFLQKTIVDMLEMQTRLIEADEWSGKTNDQIGKMKENLMKAIRQAGAGNIDIETIISNQKEQIHNLYFQLDTANRRLSEIYESDGWKVLKKYYTVKGKLLPEDSRRYKILKKIVNKLRGKTGKRIGAKPTNSSSVIINKEKIPPENITSYNPIEFPFFESPAVSIVIPAYNGWDLTYKCLSSIKANTLGVSYEIIIGDDASTDKTRNIKNYIGNITVIRNENNLEFLYNCNHAATFAKGKYILFLNNDTEVMPGWLSSMVDLMEDNETIGMVGSKLVYPNGMLQEAGGIIWKDGSGWNFGHNQDPQLPEFNYVRETDYISGASIIIRAKLWKEIGGFDERYVPAYCEDSDLAFEVRKHGYKVVYQPWSEVIHFEGYTHGTDQNDGIKGSEIKAYQKLNNEKFREKWKDILEKEHFSNGENIFWARDRSQNRKTILVIDHYVPQFDKDAGSGTVFHYLKLFLSLNLNVKFIGDNFYRDEPYTSTLQQMGIEVLYGPNYADNWRHWIKDNHEKIDFVLLNRPHIAIKYIDFVRKNTKARILYYGHDLHFIREQKQYEIEKDPNLLKSLQEWKKKETYIFSRSDLILTPSDEEKQAIDNIIGTNDKTKTILPYFFENFPNPITDFSKRSNILFVGGFTHKPNVDAVLWFHNEIWPSIKKEIPDAKFIVVGSNTPDQIFHIASQDVIIKGHLRQDELEEIYSSVKIIAIPLRYGAGVKGKTVEAMHKGVPLVSTSFGVEGLPGDFSFLQVTDDPKEFAERICKLYASAANLMEQSTKSINYIRDNFSEEKARMVFKDILEIP